MQLLNLSIYAHDFTPLYSESQQAYDTNVSETFFEFVIEEVLDHKNAIPEQTNSPGKGFHFSKGVSFVAIKFPPAYHLPEINQPLHTMRIPLKEAYKYLYAREINPPPPKA